MERLTLVNPTKSGLLFIAIMFYKVIKSVGLLQEVIARQAQKSPIRKIDGDIHEFISMLQYHKLVLLPRASTSQWIFKEMKRLSRISVTFSSHAPSDCSTFVACLFIIYSTMGRLPSSLRRFRLRWCCRRRRRCHCSCLFIYVLNVCEWEQCVGVLPMPSVRSWRELSLRKAHSWRSQFKLVFQRSAWHCAQSQ